MEQGSSNGTILWGLLLTLLAISSAFAANDEYTRPSLKGLTGVAVRVNVDQELEQSGLEATGIEEDVARKLAQAGIRVLPFNLEFLRAPGQPVLEIDILAFERDGLVAFSIDVNLQQTASLTRAQIISIEGISRLSAETWSTAGIGTVGLDNVLQIRESVKGYVDESSSTPGSRSGQGLS